jgi:putative tryptophan/tyrosine transport system substrate-binding protein
MRRREVIALFGGAAASSLLRPLDARAQQPALPVVAFINSGTADVQTTRLAAFRKGMSEAGYLESQNVTVEYHWMNGHYEGLPALLDDLVRRRVAVIATPGSNPAALAAKAATASIPIVFGVAEDPVALGLVASLAHPGGNATGVNFFAAEIDAKRLGLMHELLPKVMRFAVLVNPTNATSTETTTKALKEAAPSIGLELFFGNASTPAEIDTAFAAFARERASALFIAPDGFFGSRGAQFAALTARDRLPTSYVSRETVEAGLLMSYGTSFDDMFRQIGIYTGSILKGTKPADLPVLQSTKFEFILNLKTARSLGVDIPPTLLARADEVIE